MLCFFFSTIDVRLARPPPRGDVAVISVSDVLRGPFTCRLFFPCALLMLLHSGDFVALEVKRCWSGFRLMSRISVFSVRVLVFGSGRSAYSTYIHTTHQGGLVLWCCPGRPINAYGKMMACYLEGLFVYGGQGFKARQNRAHLCPDLSSWSAD